MKFYSTANRQHRAGLKEAVLRGLAPDNGLYMPEHIPAMPTAFFAGMQSGTFTDIAFRVSSHLLGDAIPSAELKTIVEHTLAFDAPLIEVEKDLYALELFHGPTMAFKDFGARFMSRLLAYFAREEQKEIVILVATSGDTGSAVANGFLGVKGVRVIVLYPSGKVSDIQEKQFTTLGRNITALEVDGTFDDCQRLVKQAFQDEELKREFFLTSANSINIARLIPQMFYYFRAYAQIKNGRPLVVSVPSGNFGNLTAGLMAKRMGLPIAKFVVSTNANDIVPAFLATGEFHPRPSVQTISNAMDVGNPSNFDRMMDLYDHNIAALKSDIAAYAVSDEETREAMRQIHASTGYIMDPHGAVACVGLKKFLGPEKAAVNGVFFETAHPGKFMDVVESVLNQKIALPPRLSEFVSGTKSSIAIPADFESFRSLLTGQLRQTPA